MSLISTMVQQQQDPFDNSARNYNLHEYVSRDRTNLLQPEKITYASAGHLLETYVDALHVVLLLNEPSFLVRLKESPETIRNPTFIRPVHGLPPHYVIDSIGNYNESPSFFVRHMIGMANEPSRQDTKQPPATQFAQDVHAQLRITGIRFSESLPASYFPPRGQGDVLNSIQWTNLRRNNPNNAVNEFKAMIVDFKQLFQRFSRDYRNQLSDMAQSITSTQSTPEQKRQIFEAFECSSELEEFNRRLAPIIDRLTVALTPPVLNYVFIAYQGRTLQLANQPLNPAFPFSTPALLLSALGHVGRHQIDHTFFPRQAFYYYLKVIGVESSVSDNIERLNRHISNSLKADGRTPEDDLLFPEVSRQLFVDTVRTHQRGIQFLYRFHKTVGILNRIYPDGKEDIAFHDMRELLSFAGAHVELEKVDTPREAATLLYAIERRLRSIDPISATLNRTVGELLNKAGHLGRRNLFSMVSAKLRNDINALLGAIESDDRVPLSVVREITPAMNLVRASLC